MANPIHQEQEALLAADYIADDASATVVWLARTLQKPVLVEGPAGVGKTAIAQAFARAHNLKLLRLQCYEGIDEARALYEWNYKKQLLHIQAVANRQLEVSDVEQAVFSEAFLLARPLLQAVTAEEPVCLLIDEIDKVDYAFEAMLLELLAEFQVTVPEFGTLTARSAPLVFLTSNASRELSEALKRRCLYLYLDFPDPATEQRILERRIPGLNPELAAKLAAALADLRTLPLKKRPSIAESIDWARALLAMGHQDLDRSLLRDTLNILLKYREDIALAKAKIPASGSLEGPLFNREKRP
ncbi:MAG: AAA family ATPase [Solirubrobacterales bacterium]